MVPSSIESDSRGMLMSLTAEILAELAWIDLRPAVDELLLVKRLQVVAQCLLHAPGLLRRAIPEQDHLTVLDVDDFDRRGVAARDLEVVATLGGHPFPPDPSGVHTLGTVAMRSRARAVAASSR